MTTADVQLAAVAALLGAVLVVGAWVARTRRAGT